MLNSPLLVRKNEANLLYSEQLIGQCSTCFGYHFLHISQVILVISQDILVISQDIPWNMAYRAEYAK